MAKKIEITGFWSYVRAVLFNPSWEFFTTGTVFTLFSVLTWWRDNTAPKELLEKWDIRRVLPHWSPSVWLCIGMGILLCLVIRTAYEVWAEQNGIISHLRQPESLPDTAPEVSLEEEFPVNLKPPRSLELCNISSNENLYNIVFQPVRHPSGMLINWKPGSTPILRPGERVTITPEAVLQEGQRAETYNGLTSILKLMTEKAAQREYDIGPIAFSCEDSSQIRYLVTFTVSFAGGSFLTVRDLDRRRIGSRPSFYSPIR